MLPLRDLSRYGRSGLAAGCQTPLISQTMVFENPEQCAAANRRERVGGARGEVQVAPLSKLPSRRRAAVTGAGARRWYLAGKSPVRPFVSPYHLQGLVIGDYIPCCMLTFFYLRSAEGSADQFSWRAITWIGRSAALLFLQISRYLLQKAPCSPSQSKRRASTRINLRFPSVALRVRFVGSSRAVRSLPRASIGPARRPTLPHLAGFRPRSA